MLCKVKVKLNGEHSDDVHENLKLAVMDAVEKITPADMAGYYPGNFVHVP